MDDNIQHSTNKDNGEESEMLTDERNILIPDLTIVEDDGSATGTADGNIMEQKESTAVMYRVMQVGSSGEVIELPQIVTGNFNTGTTQQAIINPLNSGQFYIVGAPAEMLQSGGTHQRNINIAPSRGNNAAQINRESTVISPRNGAQSEPRDDRRRVSHNEVERRRRDKINTWIHKLGKIMPDSVHNDTGKTGQQSKGGILSKACDYITDIRTANQRLAEALRQSEHHVEELQTENAALRKELEQLHSSMSGIGKS